MVLSCARSGQSWRSWTPTRAEEWGGGRKWCRGFTRSAASRKMSGRLLPWLNDSLLPFTSTHPWVASSNQNFLLLSMNLIWHLCFRVHFFISFFFSSFQRTKDKLIREMRSLFNTLKFIHTLAPNESSQRLSPLLMKVRFINLWIIHDDF